MTTAYANEHKDGLYINHYGMGVRRVHSGFDLICEREDDGQWVEFCRFNEMSNDYAYAESNERCQAEVASRSAKVAMNVGAV